MNNQSLADATPGPWECNGSLIVGNDGKTAVCQMGKTVTAAERKANARLVVHAPQMYKMLVELQMFYTNPTDERRKRLDGLLDSLEARS